MCLGPLLMIFRALLTTRRLSERNRKVLEKNSDTLEQDKMLVTADDAKLEMRRAILDCAWPASADSRQKIWMPELARKLGLPVGRLYNIFAGETVPKWHEGETILNRARERRKMQARWIDLQAGIQIDALNAEQARIEANVGDQALVDETKAGPADPQDSPLPGIG